MRGRQPAGTVRAYRQDILVQAEPLQFGWQVVVCGRGGNTGESEGKGGKQCGQRKSGHGKTPVVGAAVRQAVQRHGGADICHIIRRAWLKKSE